MKVINKVLAATVIAASTTACSGTLQYESVWSEAKDLNVGTAETIARRGDTQVGLVHSGKSMAEQHKQTDYFEGRRLQQTEYTARHNAKYKAKNPLAGRK